MQATSPMMRLITITMTAAILFTGCASNTASKSVNTDNLNELQNLTSTSTPKKTEDSISRIRVEALKETALTLGAQSGLAYRSKQINKDLKGKAQSLRNVFNFGALLLAHGVQPPVLVTGENTLNYESPYVLRISDKNYTIVKPAQFVTAPATWRDYLWMRFKTPELPHKTLLPRDADEEKIWREYVTIGWKNGITQANSIFKTNLARLKRDYDGMLLYRELLAKHMISKPYVAKTNLGVTGDGNSININDQVLRITASSELQTDSKEWKPVLVK